MRVILITGLLIVSLGLGAQVAINTNGNTPNASAILDLQSTTKGFLPPRMTVVERNAISNPDAGLIVFNLTTKRPNYYTGLQWETFDDTWAGCGDTVTYYGQNYNTVLIGSQCWIAENMNVGTMINGNSNPSNNGVIEKYCYDNNTANCNTYGGLYQWNEMMQYVGAEGSQGICPSNWHIPSDADWKTMEMYLGMSQSDADNTEWRGTNQGSKMAGNGGLWVTGVLENNSEFGASGLDILPTGFLNTPSGSSYYQGQSTYLWTSSLTGYDVWVRFFFYDRADVKRENYAKFYGFAVRCVKD